MHASVIWKLTGLPRWLSGKESAFNAGNTDDASLIPGSGRSPGGGNSNPLQYSCLDNSMDRGPQRVIVHGVEESDTAEHSTALLACLFLKCNCPTTLF